MINHVNFDPENTKQLAMAALFSLIGALIGGLMYPGIGTLLGEMCAAG